MVRFPANIQEISLLLNIQNGPEVKVNQSHCRPEVPRSFQEVKVPRLRDMAHNGGKVVSLKHRLLFTTQEILLVLIPVRGWVDPRGKDFMSMKN